MSVLATLDLAVGEWRFVVAPESPFPDIEVGFCEGKSAAVFDGLTFGLSVTVDGDKKFAASYPPEGMTYLRTDQTYLSNDRVSLSVDDVATLSVWAENGGQRYEADVTFIVPRPVQPYPSWLWNGDGWEPPIPYPDDDTFYSWDEDSVTWVEIADALQS